MTEGMANAKLLGQKGFNFRNKRDTSMYVVTANENIPVSYQKAVKINKKFHTIY